MAEGKDIELICCLSKGWTSETIKVKRIGGETNRNYRVEDKEGLWFVRLPWGGVEIVDREIEAQNILALRKCKTLVEVLPNYHLYLLRGRNILSSEPMKDINLPDGTMVVNYLEGKNLDAELLEKSDVQDALVRTLHLFHTSGIRFVNSYDPFKDKISKYKNEAKRNPVDELVGVKVFEEVEEVEKIMEEKLSLGEGISTHNDLIFGNLLLGKNGGVYLLDFEYAGFNVRGGLYYDFGTLFGENLFDKRPLEIKSYKEILERVPRVYGRKFDPSKAYCGALVNVMVTFWWGLVEYFNAETEERKKYFLEYIPKRIQGIRFLREIGEKTKDYWGGAL